eukprot:CAMPEP_0172499220 /NCGR_PEP_ID=MMETSP1066-20121228/123984_1 /TAXON_ID=671091 /ORGANISM="Coscinodiscus wailesii, Strain CCMP2513" /LENGTH=200 /DNA_ID=CAMNT_0013272833 /DNA_START=199 /DNA_END=798 /DNA_ORIENTATION=-
MSLELPPPRTATTTRRQWLVRTGLGTSAGAITAAAVSPIAPAKANPSFVSSIQGPVQDAIAPGHWLGQFVGINSKTETWEFPNNSPEDVSAALVDVLKDLTPDRRAKLLIPEFEIRRADPTNVHVLTWTKLEWLDTFDVTFRKSDGGNGCVATARFYATGFLPTGVPFAPLVNVAMAWFPFASPGPRGEMLQDFRLRALK